MKKIRFEVVKFSSGPGLSCLDRVGVPPGNLLRLRLMDVLIIARNELDTIERRLENGKPRI